jgi:hypothetical protein
MAGKADVLERLHALLDARKGQTRIGSIERVVIEEAVDVFSAALQQLTALQTCNAT